jgi:hypothetical protein
MVASGRSIYHVMGITFHLSSKDLILLFPRDLPPCLALYPYLAVTLSS